MTAHTKKVYSKPVIEEIARLDRFIGAGSDAKFKDNVSYKLPNGQFVYFETSDPTVFMMGMDVGMGMGM
jgi:hypothetical protein